MKSQRVAGIRRLRWALWLGLAAIPALYAPTVAAQEKADCASCHDLTKKLEASKHAALTCDTCHDQHTAYPHPKNAPKPECSSCHSDINKMFVMSVHGRERAKGNTGAPECASCHGSAHEVTSATTEAFRKTVPETCGMCHSEIGEQFQKSEHGKALTAGVKEAPTCTDCHGEHAILEKSRKDSPVNKAQIRDTCARCHGDLRLAGRFGLPADRITSFDASFHGLAAKGGSQTVANCASCHGFHTVLKSSDPNSMTHPTNLAKTCGQCHPGAGDRFALGTIHWLEGGQEPGGVRYVRLFYWGVIPLTLGLMFLHHAGDFVRKLIALRFRKGGATGRASEGIPGEMRMLPFERIQHAMLALSFIILGWTGFALKFPDTFWAQPLVMWESLWPVRGTVHRIAAVVFTACGLLHVVSLMVNRQLRQHWMTLLPRGRDVSEGIAQMMYNLGLRKTKPVVSPHSYAEKVEYWAVVWGALVMGVSGALLWFNNWAMAQFPKNWLDIATAVHYYEAVLACAAIVIWHFYSVLFDPDVYPMDTAWLTGRTVRKRPPHKEHDSSPAHGD
ncbi:MAG: cytochrome b/b6 domain-containing protein [Bryobacterales bacterium]|nr:cytochrome b/b6 domain-containing protein [Bryobacterales bacterium]